MYNTVIEGEKGKFRHEYKYLIGIPQYYTLRQRIKTVARVDPYAGDDGYYSISSLYFDNCDDKALREKLDGLNCREKFRLRYYNGDKNKIFLEKKQKIGSLCNKTQCGITYDQCKSIINGEDWMTDDAEPLLTELSFKMKSQLLRPQTLVIYKREPFIYEPGNVRVTFDSEIRSGSPESFIGSDPHSVPVEPGTTIILEVKFDEFLPLVISDVLQIGDIRQNAFSKYAACRIN
jgi:SPX domain-containing protein involved in vacuolar polyphosphate accumulation